MPTLDTLNALANAVPVLNKKAADKAEANRTYQTKQQVGAATVQPGMSTTRMAQTAAPQAVAQQAHAA